MSSSHTTHVLRRVLRKLGLKVTTQRWTILALLSRDKLHFTAQDLLSRVRQLEPGIGFATVYRFLRILVKHGYVTEVKVGGLPARFEWADKAHHDHLTCTQCRKIFEFQNKQIEDLQAKVAISFGFVLTGHLLELFGVCPRCQKPSHGAHGAHGEQ